MAPRAFGALFALVAALAFATAFAGGLVPTTIPGWWDGHPTVQGKELERKSIHVGLLEADGCNHGEEVKCEVVPTGHTLDVVGIAELAALGLGIVTALMAAFSMWKLGDRRKFLGKLLLFEVMLIGGGAGAIFFHGPDLKFAMQVGIPVGIGFYAVAGGAVLALFGSIIAMRLEPEPLRLKTSEQRIQQPHQTQPAFDVRELLRDNQQGGMRVSQPHMMPPGPGGPLPGPHGPLGAPMGPLPGQHPMNPAPGHQPLFETAPHLRPLYDMQNAGAAPNPLPPQMPTRAPTPVSRSAMGDMLGISLPPPLEAPTPATRGPRPDEYSARPDDFQAGDSASLHAPIAPYSPPRSIEQTADLERQSQSSVDPDPFEEPPPSKSRPRAPQFNESPTTPRFGNTPPENAAARAARVGAMPRAARPSVPPPRIVASKHPTIATAVPPMPNAEPLEPSTSVEIDAEAKARSRAAKSVQQERPSDLAMTMPVDRHSASAFDHTDESVIAPPLARGDHATDENPFVAAQSPPTEPVGDSTSQNAPENFEELETRDANKFTAEELSMGATELGPLSPMMLVPPRAGTQPRGSSKSGEHAARSENKGPTSHVTRPPVDDNGDEATEFGAQPREPKETNIKARGYAAPAEYGDQPAEPPTFAASTAQIAAARPRSDSEAPTAFARSKNDEAATAFGGAKPRPSEVAARPAYEPDEHEAPTAFKKPPASPPRPTSTTKSPPPSPTATSKSPPAPLPPPSAPRTTPPPTSMAKPADDASPFPVAPSAGTFDPPKPIPRVAKPSSPPGSGSKVPSFGSKLPSIVPSNGIGKPPSNLEPSQSTNKASTTNTPSPFATIPSPFGPSGGRAKPSTIDEAVTRPARQNATSDPPTAPATPEHDDARAGEAPTTPPQRPSEAPTRATGSTAFSNREAARAAAASSNGEHETPTRALGSNGATTGDGPRPRWRPASESPTSHATANEFVDATERDRKPVPSRGAGRDDLPQGTSGEISAKPARPSAETQHAQAPSRARPGDASTPMTRSSGLHEAATVSARDHELPKTSLPTGPSTGRRSTTSRATAPPMSTAPSSLPPPKKMPAASSGPTPACPQCEAPMAWVEEHLRFYCASCRMYF